MKVPSRFAIAVLTLVSAIAQPRPLLPLVDGAAAMNLIVKQVPPAFPRNPSGVQGVVHVVVEIGADGKLEDARVAGGPEVLREPALENIRQWTFRPYLQSGKPTAARANFDVVFKRQ